MTLDLSSLDDAARARRPDIIEYRNGVSTRISETTRTLAFGTLASCYALLFAEQATAALFAAQRNLILIASVFALLSVMTDALHYLFNYINAQAALRSAKQLYPNDWSMTGGKTCFTAKQVFAYFAGMLLLFAIAQALRIADMLTPLADIVFSFRLGR